MRKTQDARRSIDLRANNGLPRLAPQAPSRSPHPRPRPLERSVAIETAHVESSQLNHHTGIAFSLSAWVTPLLLLPSNPSRSTIDQFNATIARGAKYLQPSSRVSGFLFLSLTLLISQHPDPDVAWKWKLYGAAFLAVMQVAWYEVYFIFPINDTIKAIGEAMARSGEQELSEAEQKRLRELVLKWERRHRWRIVMPFFGCVVTVVAILI